MSSPGPAAADDDDQSVDGLKPKEAPLRQGGTDPL